MKASELVEELQKLIQEHGDLELYMYNYFGEDGGKVLRINYEEKIEKALYYQAGAPGRGKGFCIIGDMTFTASELQAMREYDEKEIIEGLNEDEKKEWEKQ